MILDVQVYEEKKKVIIVLPTPNFVNTGVYKKKKKENILPERINIHVAICSQCLMLKNQQKERLFEKSNFPSSPM